MDMSIYLTAPLQLDKICRACLTEKGDMRPLFGACLDEMLISFASLQVNVRNQTTLKLSITFRFRINACVVEKDTTSARLSILLKYFTSNWFKFKCTFSSSIMIKYNASQPAILYLKFMKKNVLRHFLIAPIIF